MKHKIVCLSGVVVALLSLAAEQQFTTQAVKADQLQLAAFARQDLPLNNGWTYRFGKETEGRLVDLPHDFQFEQPWHQKAGGARGFKECGTTAVYTNTFAYDPAWEGKRVYLAFEAIMSSGEVEVNGRKVGECDYGYLGCTVDVTDQLVKDKPNTVKVSCTTGAGRGSRWYTGGGLICPVHIVVKSPVSVVEDGLRVVAEPCRGGESESWTVGVEVQLDGYRGLGRKNELKVLATITDPIGRIVGTGETIAPWSKLRHQRVNLPPITVAAPQLWDLSTPNLYTCEVKLVLNGKEIDQVSDRFGFRTVEFGKDFGFKLNGRKVWLVGMANHHDLGALGAAAFDDGIRRMMKTIKRFGYNTIRCSHNPYSKGFYRIADEEGLLIVDELYDKWGFSGGTWWIGSRKQGEVWPAHMKRWIMRDRNHPSVILWSFGNEFQMNEDICGYDTDDWGVTTYRMMREYARRYDPTRLTTAAMFPARAGAVGKNDPRDLYDSYDPPELSTVTDVSSFNYQPHAYAGYLEKAPWMTLFQSEATTSEWLKPMNLMDREKMVGLCYWGAIEYWGESNGWPKKGWNFSFFSETLEPFPTAWLIQSGAEQEKPIVHLGVLEKGGERTSWNEQKSGQEKIRENWTRKPGSKADVVVFSNQDEVELFLNGKSLGKRTVPHGATARANAVWYRGVTWEPGELKAVAGEISHAIRSAGPVVRLRTTVDYEGDELVYARVVGVDAEGRENLAATGKVRVRVSGGGSLYALSNGDHCTDELFTSDIDVKDLHDGTLQVIVRKTPGETKPVKIEAGFVKSTSSTLQE